MSDDKSWWYGDPDAWRITDDWADGPDGRKAYTDKGRLWVIGRGGQMSACVPVETARALLGVPDVRAEIAAAMHRLVENWAARPAGTDDRGFSDGLGFAKGAVDALADRIESWPVPAGTPDVAGALALLREAYDADRGTMDVGECLDVFEGAIKRAIAALEGKGT